MSMSSARIMYVVKRMQTACRNGLDQFLADLEITPGQYTVLSLLAASKLQSSAEVARQAGVSPQSMGELISQLERQELIERFENPEHRRMLHIRLTRKGTNMLAKCEKRVDELEASLFAGVSPADVDVFRRVASTLVDNSLNMPASGAAS